MNEVHGLDEKSLNCTLGRRFSWAHKAWASAGFGVFRGESRPEWLELSLMNRRLCGVILVCLGLVVAWIVFRSLKKDGETSEVVVSRLVATEELILELTPKLKDLSGDLMNLHFPGEDHAAYFAKEVVVHDFESGEEDGSWIPGGEKKGKVGELGFWGRLLDDVSYFEHVGLKIERGEFEGEGENRFVGRVLFSGLARGLDGKWMQYSGKQDVTWEKNDGDWVISNWKGVALETEEADEVFFRDRLDEVLSDEDRLRAKTSEHRRALNYYYESGKTRAPSQDFAPIAMNLKPAVSVADVNGDGFDDIYVMVRLGKNLLLINQGDGTFSEQAGDFELAFPGGATCGLFADFDNDGDSDLMLGGGLQRTLYLENTGGWFRKVEQKSPLPFLAVSMSAADFNGDGLLDLYIPTYRRGDLGSLLPGSPGGAGTQTWCDQYLPKDEAGEYLRRYEESRKSAEHQGYLDQVGPANVMLVNRGDGQFERVHAKDPVSAWKNTLQATWADYDEDGDPDLYLANDWSVDQLFRNEGEQGFVEVTKEAGLTAMGFGMGASWGDYDGDGRDDLYVTNMYSKAGRRVLAQFGQMDPRFMESAEGNFLYRQEENGRFSRVSGFKPPKMMVAKAGWSWGGQFFDFDNDRDLDIHVLSGYFTAPKKFESDVDL